MTNPTKFATIEVAWGAQKAHLYHSESNMADIEFHKTEDEARKRVASLIQKDGAKMVAVIEIKDLFEAAITAQKVA